MIEMRLYKDKMELVIDDNFTSLAKAFDDRPFGQRRTGWNREFVVLGNSLVFKGPLDIDKYTVIDIRVKIMQKWRTPLVILPTKFMRVKEGFFAVYPNVDDMESEVRVIRHREKMRFRGAHREYSVLVRKSLVKVNNLLEGTDSDWIFDKYGVDIVVALTHLWILKVGDTGIFNMVARIDRREIYIIDYDEMLDEDREDELFYFDKRPAVRFNWYERIRKHYREAAERVSDLLNDPSNSKVFPRIERAVTLLYKFSTMPVG